MAEPLKTVEILTTKEDWAKVDTTCETQPWCYFRDDLSDKGAKWVMEVVRWLVEAMEIGAIKSNSSDHYVPWFAFTPSGMLMFKWIDNNLDSGTIEFNIHPTLQELVVFITYDYRYGQVQYYNEPLTPKQMLTLSDEVTRRSYTSDEDRALFSKCKWCLP